MHISDSKYYVINIVAKHVCAYLLTSLKASGNNDQSQTSQLSRFGRVTHDFTTDLTTAYQSHDFSRFSINIIILVRLIEIILLLCA